MKKVVSLFIALFVVNTINIFAQKVELNYENTFASAFESANVPAKGTASISFSYGDVNVAIECIGYTTRKHKGVVLDEDLGGLEFCGDPDEYGAAKITLKLTEPDDPNARKKYIKKVIFETRGTSDIAGVRVTNNAESENYVTVNNNTVEVEDGYSAISQFDIYFDFSEYVTFTGIKVECGYFDEELSLKDKDGYQYFGEYHYAKKVTYTRSMNSKKWGSLCLPFDFVVDDKNFSVYGLYNAGYNNSNVPVTLYKYATGKVVKAGTPLIVYCDAPTLVVKAQNVLVSTDNFNANGISTDDGVTVSTNINFTLYGTIKSATMTDGIYVSNDKFYYLKSGSQCTIKPYRAYFILEGNTNDSRTRTIDFNVLDENDSEFNGFSFAGSDDATAVESVDTDAEETVLGIFTADGKKVDELQKGLNIVKTTNGVKKVYIR